MALIRNFGLLKTIAQTSTRSIVTSASRQSDSLFVHRENDINIEKFEFTDDNKKVLFGL